MATTKRDAGKRGGKARGAPDPMDKSLFVRASQDMLDALDDWAAEIGIERGGAVSRSDVVRELIQRALNERKGRKQ